MPNLKSKPKPSPKMGPEMKTRDPKMGARAESLMLKMLESKGKKVKR